jgi:fructose/tagatose bisphosphate aldolase
MDTLAHKALEREQATPAFTCYDCTALAVVAAAEAAAPSIIVLVPPAVATGTTVSRLVAALRRLADAADTPVSIQLDQTDPEAVKALPGTRAHYPYLRRRHRLALSLYERCPEA